MGKTKSGYNPILRMVLGPLIVCFAGPLLGDNGDEDLLRQAKQIFTPMPQIMLSEKNPITPSPFNSFLKGNKGVLKEQEKRGLKHLKSDRSRWKLKEKLRPARWQ